MGFMSGFLNFIGLVEEEKQPYYPNMAQYNNAQRGQANKGAANRSVNGVNNQQQRPKQRPVPQQMPQTPFAQGSFAPPMGNITPMPQANKPASMAQPGEHHRTVIWYLRQFEDCRDIINDLLDGKSVLLILEDVDERVCQRAVDMLSGAAFALDASLRRASHATYFIAPRSVVVSGNSEDTPAVYGLRGDMR